jgi:hypothetical protein
VNEVIRCRYRETVGIQVHVDIHRINLPLFSTILPSDSMLFLSCRPFVVITTFSTGLVDVEVVDVEVI